MASADWKCKGHGGTEAKAYLEHNDKDKRLEHEHGNKNINKNLTKDNKSVYGLTYDEKCEKYDKLIEKLSQNSRMTKATTTYIGIEVPIPNSIPKDKQFLYTQRVHAIVCDLVGEENIIDTEYHQDEKHWYTNAKTKERCLSLNHIHIETVPGVDGRLCGKEFSSRKRMIELNNAIERMTEAEFGCKFLTGEGTKSKESVEELKIASRKAEIDAQEESLLKRKRKQSEDEKTWKEQADKKDAELEARESRLKAREDHLDNLLYQRFKEGYKKGVEDEKKRSKAIQTTITKGQNIEQTQRVPQSQAERDIMSKWQ